MITVTVEPAPPTVAITASPADGAVVPYGTRLTFVAEASDLKDGDLTAQIVWTSSVDGPLGTGSSISGMLGVGGHFITARVTDSDGLVNSSTITVTVLPPDPSVPSLPR